MVWNLLGVPGDPSSLREAHHGAPEARELPLAAPSGAAPAAAGGEVTEEVRRIYRSCRRSSGAATSPLCSIHAGARLSLPASGEPEQQGSIFIESYTQGRTPAVYRKIAAELPSDD